MERNANYALVGLASAILSIGLVVFVVWLAGSGLNQSYDLYDIVFQGPVRGLAQGGEVHFNGIKVGEVSKISLDPRDPRYVIARAKVTSDVPIRQDSYATLEPQGITGVNYIQITAGSASRPLLKETVPPGQIPRMKSQKDALSDLLAGGGFIVQRTVEVLDRVNRVFSDENIKTIGATLSDVQAVTAELRERKSIIADAQKTLQSADEAAQQIRDLAKSSNGLVNGDAKRTLSKLGDAAGEIEATAKQLRGMVDKLQGPDHRFRHQRSAGDQRRDRQPAALFGPAQSADERSSVQPPRLGGQGAGQAIRGETMNPFALARARPRCCSRRIARVGCISLLPKQKPAQLYRFGVSLAPAASRPAGQERFLPFLWLPPNFLEHQAAGRDQASSGHLHRRPGGLHLGLALGDLGRDPVRRGRDSRLRR